MTAQPQSINDHRHTERREGWHTPVDCYKLLATQEMVAGLHDEMAGVNKRLDDGHARMCAIEASVDAVTRTIDAGVIAHARLEKKLDANNRATDELLEIISMGKGFFKWTGRIANFLRQAILWLLPVVTAILAFWYLVTGQHPK